MRSRKSIIPQQASGEIPSRMNNQSIDPDSILSEEFEYIRETAFQAHEDRARVTSYYLVTVGSLAAAIVGSQIPQFQTQESYLPFACLFILLVVDGVLTLLQLVRLRQAWHESAKAMAKIKAYYLEQYPELKEAFLWKTETVPPCYKPWSVSYLLALQVSILTGAVAGAAVLLAGRGFELNWVPEAVAAVVLLFVFQMYLYRKLLIKH